MSRKRRINTEESQIKRRGSADDLFAAADLFDSIVSSVSPITPKSGHYSKPIQQTTKYTKYIASSEERVRASPFLSAVLELQEFSRILSQTVFKLQQARADALNTLDSIAQFIKQNAAINPDFLRMKLAKEIGIRNEIASFCIKESARLRQNIIEVESFITFIQNSDKKNYYLTQDYLGSEVDVGTFTDKKAKILFHQQPVHFPIIDDSCPEVDIFHKPHTTQSDILRRMVEKFDQLEADDAMFIIESLGKGLNDNNSAEEVFFEEAWKVQSYPWSNVLFCMADVSKVVPKVFNPVYLPDQYSLLTFEELNMLSSWPLKKLVQKLDSIIFDINPYTICRKFWDVIDGINNVVRSLAPFPKSEEPLDFDQLFVYLIIIVFATLSPSVTYGLTYAASYSNSIENDTKMKYAMSHLEGLTTYLISLNYADLNRKSKELIQKQVREDDGDPLGFL